MEPLAIFGLGVPELLIILAVVLLLFGGSRLAGLGKSSGRALKEFKEETRGLKSEQEQPGQISGTNPYEPGGTAYPPQQSAAPQPGPAQPYGDPTAGGAPYQQPPQTPGDPTDRDLRRDV